MHSSSTQAQPGNWLAGQLENWRNRFVNLDAEKLASTQQSIFCVVVIVPLIFLSIFNREVLHIPTLAAGVALLVVGTVWAILVRHSRLTKHLDLLLPLVDFCGLGLARWATLPEGDQLSSLALAPGLWLVARYRSRGLLIGLVAITLTISVPSLAILRELDIADYLRFAALPVAFIIVSSLVLTLIDRLSYQHDELERGERLLTGVINHLNVGVLVMDADGNDVLGNAAQQRIHAIVSPKGNPDPTEAGHLLFTMQGEVLPREQRPAQRVINGQTFDDTLVLAGAPMSEQRVLKVTSRIITGQDHNVESRILIFDDITETYHAQHAQQEIIATVSHELRTPLTSILGYTDFALETVTELPLEERQELEVFLTVIERNGMKLLARVEDLLLQQQAQRGRLTLHPEVTSLTKLVRDALEAQQARATERNIELSLDAAENTEIWADPQRISQVIDNIVANALNYTPVGGHVLVRTYRDEDYNVPRSEAVFAVTDTGPGLNQLEQRSLFAPFFRSSSAAESTSGTGLGLPVSKGIVESHGGRIVVESTPGDGSTFSVHLPLYQGYVS